ncbi:MAG: BrnA antitoxin family protein [Clostridiales bacterium]|nr:BrnA antitoxin family protein [Clostridiales bacterium]
MAKNEKIIRTAIHTGQQPTEEQIREIEAASARPVMTDDEAPELTLDQYAEMAALARSRRNRQVKPVIALRISIDTLDKAKATGKGYTGFLSRLLDNAINDPQMVAKSL